MQIQFLVSAVSHMGDEWVVHEPGSVVDMPDSDAKILIADGSAVPVEEPKPTPARKKVV